MMGWRLGLGLGLGLGVEVMVIVADERALDWVELS